MKLSVVTSLYESAEHLTAFHERMGREAQRLGLDYEMVYVNDGSPDASLDRALGIARDDPRVLVVDLSRNFGHHKAMMTGLAHARGDLVFLIDCDLEEDPELLSVFHVTMRDTKADVVYGVQERRKGGILERWGGEVFFRLFNLLTDDPLPMNLTTVRLMTRRYVDALLAHQERSMIIGALWVITGFAQVAVPVRKTARKRGSYTLLRRIEVFVDAVTSFSDRPLKLIFYLGFVVFLVSSLAATYLVVRRVFFGVLLAGWPSLIVSLWLLGGATLFSVGVVGIYLQKVFIETKQRPYTIVRAVHRGARSQGD